MFGLFRRKMTPNFFRDDKEIFFRSWWFASVLVLSVAKERRKFDDIVGITFFRESGMIDKEKERKVFYEVIAYASCCVIDHMRDDIERIHGWTDESYDLHIGYLISLGMALDQVFDLRSNDEGIFVDLLDDYYHPDCGDDYDEFWGLDNEMSDAEYEESCNKTLGEFIEDTMAEEDDDDRNIGRYYAFRIGQIYNVVDPAKVIENAQSCCDFALKLYEPAFIKLPIKKIKADLDKLYSLQQ